ncbi:WecB/TagA/CpsF family glycosyltransferase [Prevotella sp. 10(H)]|uniref:WecB/TagA/CpsF family glycosyltransferase n=1 Tax=Prevotella sp. 10(H) TaxID=1158294 RepID=UPI0004A7178F|nr:WecB/TagA/CpsF family glycosyltransferase [Prevotella sp. 10(H)]
MLRLRNIDLIKNMGELALLPEGKLLINTINAHSYNIAQKDKLFAESLIFGGKLIPDGISIVKAVKWLNGEKLMRIAGADLFVFEMSRLNEKGGTCFFLGSSENVLSLMKQRASKDYPNINIITYSPPYKAEFSEEENKAMIDAVNTNNPDLLWIGMTAPKQEKWAYTHYRELNINCHIGTIGAVFDFYAGTVKRAPAWCIKLGLEWFYRLSQEPKRLWKRYIIGNLLFCGYIFIEKNRNSKSQCISTNK